MSIRKVDVLVDKLFLPVRRLALKRRAVRVGENVQLHGAPLVSVHRSSKIEISDRVALVSSSRWTALGVSRPVILRTLAPGAVIILGEDSGFSGTTVCAVVSVTVGKRCLFGADVMVSDTDFHPLEEVPRIGLSVPKGIESDAVLIEDDVFIGARTTILKGVRIGHGSVIGAGSVVTSNIPAGVIAAGNPARVLRRIEPNPRQDSIGGHDSTPASNVEELRR